MKITKYGHACLLVEEGSARLLIDPGSYSNGFEELTNLDAILITHDHHDHFEIDNIKALLKHNTDAVLLADSSSAAILADAGYTVKSMKSGDTTKIGAVEVEAIGELHAEIHSTIPQAINVGYRIGDDFFYPGDALTIPDFRVRVLAIPSVAPWSKVSETIDYLLAVKPKVAIPVHDGILSRPSLYGQMLGRFAEPIGTVLSVIEPGVTVEF